MWISKEQHEALIRADGTNFRVLKDLSDRLARVEAQLRFPNYDEYGNRPERSETVSLQSVLCKLAEKIGYDLKVNPPTPAKLAD